MNEPLESIRCPDCDSTAVITENLAVVEEHGSRRESVSLLFVRPTFHCLNCDARFSGEAGEKAQTDALALYRRVLCPPLKEYMIAGWLRANPQLVAHLGAMDLLKTWEAARATLIARLEAGDGIEPPTTGV